MKTILNKIWLAFTLAAMFLVFLPKTQFAQETKTQALDQNISIYAEDWMFDYIYNESGSIDDIEARM